MTPDDRIDSPPGAEELAAYLDGELDLSRGEAVEAWLATHPDSQAEVDSLRRLMRLYQETQPPEPDPAAWHAVLEQVRAGVAVPRPGPAPARRLVGPAVRRVLPVAAAAALVGFWLLARSWWVPPSAVEDNDDEPYPVATAEEITVISMETGDAGGLVVGQPPVSDNYEFASPRDVQVVKIEGAEHERRLPEMMHGDVPMLFAPDDAVGRRQD